MGARLALLAALGACASAAPEPSFSVALERVGTLVAWPLRVGSPPAPASVIVDTGSADLLVRAGFEYNASASSTARERGHEGQLALRVDQERVAFGDIRLLNDTVGWNSSTRDHAEFLYPRSFLWTFRHENPPFGWASAQGLFGMAYTAVASHQPTALREFLRRHAPPAVAGTSYAAMFSLRIGMPPRQPQLSFFGLDAAFADDLQWSYRSPSGSPQSHQFPVFDLSLCGVRVLGDLSSHVPALVDTGSSCLALPAEVFDAVALWAQLDCTDAEGPGSRAEPWRKTCRLPRNVSASELRRQHPVYPLPSATGAPFSSCLTHRRADLPHRLSTCGQLPALSFRVAPGGKKLLIPLGVLALDPDREQSRLCLERLAPDTLGVANIPYRASIVLGAMPMRALYAAFDMRNHTLYDPPSNQCLPPPCAAVFLFLEADEAGEYCRARPVSFSVCIGILLAALAAAELCITTHTHRNLLKLARRLKQQDSDVEYPMQVAPHRASVIPGHTADSAYHRQDDDSDTALPTPPRDTPSTTPAVSDSGRDGRGMSRQEARDAHSRPPGRGAGVYDGVMRARDFVRRYM